MKSESRCSLTSFKLTLKRHFLFFFNSVMLYISFRVILISLVKSLNFILIHFKIFVNDFTLYFSL